MSGPSRCPLCGSEIAGPHCGICGVDLDGDSGRDLIEVDQQLEQLTARRFRLLAQLSEEARRSASAPATARAGVPGWSQLPPPPPPPSSDGGGLPAFMAPYPPEAGHRGGAPILQGSAGPEVSSILLTLGTALLVIAALVFAAVSWSRIGALGQGALLVGLTLAAGFGTDRAARRGLTGTAEALGVLTVLMGPLVAQATRITAGLVAVDDRTWDNVGAWTWWPAVILLIGGAAVAFGRAVTVRSPQWLGAALVQLGVPLWTALAPLPTWVKVAIVAAQAAVVSSVVARRTVASVTGPLWWAGAVATWFWASVAAYSMVGDRDLTVSVLWPLVAAVAALAVAAAASSWAWTETPNRRDDSARSALAAGLVAVVLVLAGSLAAAVAWPAAAVVGALTAVTADRFGGRRRAALAAPCWLLVGFAAFPAMALGLLAALNAAGAASDPVWGSSFGARPVIGMTGGGVGRQAGQNPLSVLVTVIAVVVALLSDPGWRRRASVHATVAGAGVIVLVAVPPLAGLSVGATTLLLLVGAMAMVATLIWPGRVVLDRTVSLVVSSVLFVMAGLWALGTQPLTTVAVAVGLVLASALVLVALRSDDEVLAAPTTAVAATALVVEVGLLVYASGASSSWALTGSALMAALGVTVLPVGESAEARVPSRSMVLLVAAMTATMLHAGAVFALSNRGGGGPPTSAAPLTVALAVGAVAWSVAAIRRPLRSSTVWWVALAAGEGLLLVWFVLAQAEVAVLEAYTVPAAVLVAVVMAMIAKVGPGLRATTSWSLEGSPLALALWPTALIALGDPGLTRQVVGLGLGALVLAAGAVWRRRAPVDVGAAAVSVIGLQALLPYVAEVPRWISLGLVGVVLVALGATFEQRRQDFDEARRHYAALH